MRRISFSPIALALLLAVPVHADGTGGTVTLPLDDTPKVTALLAGRSHVDPEDMRAVALPALRHRQYVFPW